MLGWINKKIGTPSSGNGGSGQGDSGGNEGGGGNRTFGGSGSGQRNNGQQRDLSANDKRGGRSRRGSFLEAVGGAMAIRSSGRSKKDDKSEATALAEQLDAQHAERISCVAFKLVREIQRILKEAREKQANNAGATATTAARSSTSSTAPSSPGGSTPGAGSRMSEAATGAKRKNRWAGTDELLSLLDGGSPGGAGEVEDKVERYGSIAEVQAKMSDLVEQALVPESHGDLCGQLLEAATGDGHHPAFVKLCVDAGLPSNLVHCLRIMRVVEFESAMYDRSSTSSRGGDSRSTDAAEEGGERISSTVDTSVDEEKSKAFPLADGSSTPPPLREDERPKTERATKRIGELLVTLCRDKSAGVGEQIKPHLPGLLSLAVSAYPPNGAHVQETASAVVEALMGGCLNSSMVWLLHYNKATLDVVGEMRHLCGLDGTVVNSPLASVRSRGGYTPRSVSPRGSCKRSPRPTIGGGGGGGGGRESGAENVASEPPSTELVGAAAEESGLWLAAMRAAVSTVRCASRFVPAFVHDFESAGGYETIGFMVRRSSIDRLPAMLEQVCLLVSAMCASGVDHSALTGGAGARMEGSEMMATNPTAFSIIQSLLAECTPPVEAVCLQGVSGRISTGTCEISCLSGGYGVVDNGLDTEDAVVMVAERAVAMRLDRWGREHGLFPGEAAGSPFLLSIASSSGTDDEEDDDSGIVSCPSEGEGDSSGTETRSSRRGRRRSRRSGRGFARVSAGAGEMATTVAETDEFRLRLLEAVLGLYSNHPLNYHELETKFHVLSFFLCALPYYENRELKGLALKTLEVICVSFKDVHPRDALHSTSTAFTVCLDHMIGLLSDPLSNPYVGREVHLVGAESSVGSGSVGEGAVASAGQGLSDHVSFGREGGERGGEGVGELLQEEDPKDTAALQKALILLEDADMMRRMLEKLLEFDEKKFTAMFQATGILDQVLQPLLKRVLTLNVAACPGAPGLWRAMRHPEGLVGPTVDISADGGSGIVAGCQIWSKTGDVARVEETGALALVSRATRLLCGTLALLLGSSQAVCRQFRALRMHDTLYRIIRDFGPPSTEAALSALERACSSEPSGVPEDMAFLIELVQGSKSRAERWRQAAALMGLRSILLCKHQAVKDVWRESCGFEASLAAISSLDSAFSPTLRPAPTVLFVTHPSSPGKMSDNKEGTADTATRSANEERLCEAENFRVMQAALLTLVASASAGPVAMVRGERLIGYRANRRYLRKEISYDSLACCLVNSGVVASPTYAAPALRLLFTMVTELPCDDILLEGESGVGKSKSTGESGDGGASCSYVGDVDDVGQGATVRNADAVMVILGVLPYLSEGIAWATLGALNQIIRAGGFATAEALVTAGVARRAANILAKALHAKTAEGYKLDKNGSPRSSVDECETVTVTGKTNVEREREDGVAGGGGGASEAVAKPGGALRRQSLDAASRSRENGLWEPLWLTERIRQRIVELIILVSSRHITQADLAPIVRSITLPLVIDSRGHVAPPTVWPAGLALPPVGHVGGGQAFWLPGWGTFVPPSGGSMVVSAKSKDGAATPWPWLGVLAAMSACAQESTPFLRLGGSASTDMSSICHEVARAGWRAGSGLSSAGSVSSSAEDTDGAGKLWIEQQKALVEAALEEEVRIVHVPGLEGSASSSSGDGGVGGSTPDGSSWPGPLGYSFACWMRFNPPCTASGGVETRGTSEGTSPPGRPADMKSWKVDRGRARAGTRSAAAAGVASATGPRPEETSEGDLVESSGEDGIEGFAADERAVGTDSTDKGSPASSVGGFPAAGTADGSSSLDKRNSVDSTSGRRGDSEEDRPRPHMPGRQVLWLFAVASPDGRAFLQLFLDLDILLFCVRGSSIRGEIRFKTPQHLACGGARVWHHVLLAHSRAKSRILGTKDKLSLWVDGELADTVKVESVSFTTPEGPPCAYLGCPHPQAFLDSSVGTTIAPLWHLGPCLLVTESVELAPLMFALGPEYTGVWTAESPLEALSSANAAGALRRLQALSGAAGFEAIGGDVPHALQRRGLRELDRCFDVVDRAYYWERVDRAGVTDSFYLLLAPELVTFAYNTRHMERPGGPTPPDAAGGGGGVRISSPSDDPLQGGRGVGGSGGGGVNSEIDNDGNDYSAADGSTRPSQVPTSAKRVATLPSLVSGWLFNASRETASPSAGPGPIGCAYGNDIAVAPSGLPRELTGAGGPSVLFPLLQRAQTELALCWTLRLLARAVRGGGPSSVGYMQVGGGYIILAGLLRSRRALLGPKTVRACFEMAVDRAYDGGGAIAGGCEVGLEEEAGGDDGGNCVTRDDLGWGGDDRGLSSNVSKAERRQAGAWGWEDDIAFMPRDEVDALLRRAGVGGESGERESVGEGAGRESCENTGALCPFVLLTDPYALKHVVMNHQVWGLQDRGLMLIMLQLVHSLVSPYNSKPYCRFNARVLHRIGLFRSCLHYLLEASEPPPSTHASSKRPPSAAGADRPTKGAGAGSLGDVDVDGNADEKNISAHGRRAAAVASAGSTSRDPTPLSIAGFGGVLKPTAALAAAGLDTRDGFMVSCTLLLQRVLAICAIQRDFDRVVGATLSTLADGEAAGGRESRRAGVEPTFAPAEAVLRRVCLIGEEEEGGSGGDGGSSSSSSSSSAGDKVLSGQALVRLYLMRMLLEVMVLPVASASRGELNAAEGVYVGGVGSPCVRQAQKAAEDAAAATPAATGEMKTATAEGGGGTRLERWDGGVPPVVDVVDADRSGSPSPLYVGRQRVFKSVCSRALRPDWFISMLETCQEEAGVAWTFRLLAAMLQASEEFGSAFQKAEGFRAMATCIPRYAASFPVLLSALALVLGVPIAALPATAEGMDAISILSLLRRNAGTAPGPVRTGGNGNGSGSGGDGDPKPFVRVCLARVILPSLRVNAALLRRAEAAGLVSASAEAGAGAAAMSSSPSQEGTPTSPLLGSKERGSRRGTSVGSSYRGSPRSSFGVSAAAAEASEWRRTKRVNEIMSAAMWEALMNDPSFRLACRSPEVVGALVDVLGGTWDEPEQGVLGGNQEDSGGGGGSGGAGQDEIGVGDDAGGDGGGRGSTSGGSPSVEDFPPQATPHPPAELLRIVIGDIITSGGSVVFPALYRVFSCGAAVMGPMLTESTSRKTTVSEPAAVEASLSLSRMPRDLSPLGRESGSASAGIFQRAILRHLETCSRDAIAFAAATVPAPALRGGGAGPGKNSQRPRFVALNRALGSVAAVSAAVAEAAADGLLPGVETGHLAVGLVLSLLRQITTASVAVGGTAANDVKGTALGACHITTVVALRRTIQRESGRGGLSSRRIGEGLRVGAVGDRSSSSSEGDLLEESLLMMSHNFDAILGEERKGLAIGADGGGSSSSSTFLAGASSSGTGSLPFPPPPPGVKSPIRPKPISPNSSASTTPRDGPNGGKREMVPPPLDLSSMDQDASLDAPLTTAGMFADTPAQNKWSSRFDFPDEPPSTSAASMAAAAMDEANRLAMTFSALELPSIGSSSVGSTNTGSAHPSASGGGSKFLPLTSGSSMIGSPTGSRNSLWESATKGAAGLVAAADRGGRGGSGVGGVGGGGRGERDAGDFTGGVVESIAHRMRGSSSERAFVIGFVAELRALLLSNSDVVRRLATRLTGALLTRRRAVMQELLGEELLSTGFSMLEFSPTSGGADGVDGLGGNGNTSFAPATDEEAVAEETRAEAFALWLTGGGQEAAVREGLERATERSYTLIPHVSSAEGLTVALSRAEFVANGGEGGPGSSTLSRLGSGVGGAFGALTSGPNRKTITVDRAIQRADMIARTYERVAASHGRWVWAGADDLAWASKAWRVQLSVMRGEVSLWEGGLFGRLMRSPEANMAAMRQESEGVRQIDVERYKLDMDEGPERTRTHLLPNHDFYDTYDVLAPTACSSPGRAGVSQVPSSGTKPVPKTSSPSESSLSTLPAAAAAAAATTAVGAAAAGGGVVVTVEVVAGDTSSTDAVVTGSASPPETAAEAFAKAASAVAGASTAAAASAAAAAVSTESAAQAPLTAKTNDKKVVEGEGEQVAAITALVKTMSASVGSKGGARRKQPLQSVFDLDDTDCSALQELEELQMESATEGGDEDSFREASDSTAADPRSPTSDVGNGLPTLPADAKAVEGQGDVPIPVTPQESAAAEGHVDSGEGGSLGIPAVVECGGAGGGLEQRARERDPSRAFSLGGVTDLIDGDTSHGSEMSTLGDDNTVDGSVISAQDAEDEDRLEAGRSMCDADGGHSRGQSPLRGRSPLRAVGNARGGDTEGEANATASRVPQADGRKGVGDVEGSVVAPMAISTAPSEKRTSLDAAASAGPGVSAREEGWSDRDLLLGLIQAEDAPVLAAHDVSRSFGGILVKRGLLLVCRSAIYFVDGFGIEPALPRPDAGPPTPAAIAAAAAAAAAASHSKDPLYGVRRLEEWELGGGAGGVGGGDEDGDVCGAKIQVMLRGHGRSHFNATAAGAMKSESTTLTVEQVGGAGGGDAPGGGRATAVEDDDILALGRFGVQRFALDRLHAVYKRRYQLRDCGLELFDIFGRSILVSFSTRDKQEEVLTSLLVRGLPASIFSKRKHRLRLATGSSHAQARAAYKKFMQAERISWTKKWQSGGCTNFAYLMALNTLAGRSFNDLTQYPVMPWVLSDYVSEDLDLDNPGVYRDLSKPMGAIGEARARQFTERYAAVIEAAEETGRDPHPPPFHYGTHYSCAGYILHYLLRLEPFTRLALSLQGGRFDKADRLFRDIRSSWESASSENLQDVRELTPEFYNLPEFLVNSNGFDLGFTQKGQEVNDVVLPPWAKGDPAEFIRLHRKALESPHVSKNLHSWIGLIFGCKQRGPEAVEAQNVFVHLTYEGEVDIDSIQDPLERDAALAQIHNFGQTPSLVLKKAHPQRDLPPVVRVSNVDGSRTADPAAVERHTPLTPPLCIVGAPDAVALRPVMLSSVSGAWHYHAGGGGGVGDARMIKDKITGVGLGAVMLPKTPDKYIRFGGPGRGVSFFQSVWGGTTSSSKVSSDRLLSSHEALHLSAVTAVSCSEDGSLLLTGASDGTCRLWTIVGLQGRSGPGQVSRMLDLTASLGCHRGPVTSASVCIGSGSGVTGGADGRVLVWDIKRLTFVRELPGHRSGISSVDINKANGNVVTLSGSELRVWTVNGRLLASCSVTALKRGATPTCAVSTDCPDWQDGVVAATGHDNGDVLLWSIDWSDGPMSRGAEPIRFLGKSGGGTGGTVGTGGGDSSLCVRVLKLERVLSGAHQKRITFVRVCQGGREMLVGDSSGEISRWQCIRLDQLSSEELNQIV